MKHEEAKAFRDFDEADAAAIWPLGAGLASEALDAVGGMQCPEPAAPDVPASVGAMLAAAYFAPVLACLLTLAGSREALFMIMVACFYVLIFCGVPWLFLRVEPRRGRAPSLGEFLRGDFATATGRISGRAALAQMFVVPVTLTLCLLAIGFSAKAILPG
jgi:hypothetical protein